MRHCQNVHRARLSIAKDVYDQLIFKNKELETEIKRLRSEVFELSKFDVDAFFSWIRQRTFWTHDDRLEETIVRIPDKVLHDKFNGGV